MRSDMIWLMISILMIGAPGLLWAQDYDEIEKMSLHYFQNNQHKEVLQVLTNAQLKAHSSARLYYRAAWSAYWLGQHGLSYRWTKKVLKQSLSPGELLTLQASNARQLGHEGQSLWWESQIKKSASKNQWLQSMAIDGGVKVFKPSQTSVLQDYGLQFSHRFGHKVALLHHWHWNQQTYFWEEFKQLSMNMKWHLQLHEMWSIQLPFALALYRSDIKNTISRDDLNTVNIHGEAGQKVFQTGIESMWQHPWMQLRTGFWYIHGQTSSDYITSIIGQSQRYPSENKTEANQFHPWLDIKVRWPIFRERLQTGITFMPIQQWEQANNQQAFDYLALNVEQQRRAMYLNFRPYSIFRWGKTGWIYGEYRHKASHYMAHAESGLLFNNPNTEVQTAVLTVGKLFGTRWRVSATYLYEWGRDELYMQSIQSQGLFFQFHYQIVL